jgi:hypothetical protein
MWRPSNDKAECGGVEMMQCPKCKRFYVEWVPSYRAYACLWLNCFWMSQKPPEGEKPSHSEEKREGRAPEVQPRAARA